jgi:hypothetical protein
MAIIPFGPINRTILCCDFFIRQYLQEGASYFNPLNSKLNPICHLLALLGAHHILHVSRIRVKGVLWDTDVNKRIVISVELGLH